MGSARKMMRKKDKPVVKEQQKQARLAAEADVLSKQLNRRIDKSILQAEQNAFYKMAVITNWVLHEEFGFGHRGKESRLLKFQDRMAYLCACLHDPNCDITIEGLNEALKRETGFDTIWQLNNRRYNKDAEVV